MPTVSVVIPSRNDGVMLKTCLSLLSRQSRPADEIIVVDNASSDDTADICRAAGVRRIPVDLQGIPATAAAGFDAAAGDIIARLDTDSRPPADWLENVEAALLAAGPMSVVTGPGDFYGGSHLVRWVGRHLVLGGYFTFIGFLLGHPPVFGSNFALRRGVWQRIGDTVVRDNADVHDDFDVSYHLRPDMAVIYDRTLRVGVSSRPFSNWASLRRRLAMSLATFRVEFSEEPPLRRRLDRLRWRRGHPGAADGG
ncbi:MAG TPA: glycosyltransferase family 2 protein [Arthrobacter sp.]|nr:glycosyltransferase family 2 protein [Arthrobacter sp.]